MTGPGPVGCYPGSFDPPTIGHLALAEAAVAHAGLARLDLVLSRAALGKEPVPPDELERRRAVLEQVAARGKGLAVVVSDHQLVTDLARGYDVVVMGADKWRQVTDPRWYGGSVAARDEALASLPRVLVAPRLGDELVDLPPEAERLHLPVELRAVSASAVREGRPEAAGWALPGGNPPPPDGPA